MGLEFSLVKYAVIEEGTLVYGKHMPMTLPKGGRDYGPYLSKKTAERKLDSLKEKKIKEGWEQDPVEKNHLFKGSNNLDYTLQRIRYGNLLKFILS